MTVHKLEWAQVNIPLEGNVEGKYERACDVMQAMLKNFPSVDFDRDTLRRLITYASGDVSPENRERIQQALDACSCDGEWPGRIYREYSIVEELDDSSSTTNPVVFVKPYARDRFLSIAVTEACGVPQVRIIIDYSARPSNQHLASISAAIAAEGEFYGAVPKHGLPRPQIHTIQG